MRGLVCPIHGHRKPRPGAHAGCWTTLLSEMGIRRELPPGRRLPYSGGGHGDQNTGRVRRVSHLPQTALLNRMKHERRRPCGHAGPIGGQEPNGDHGRKAAPAKSSPDATECCTRGCKATASGDGPTTSAANGRRRRRVDLLEAGPLTIPGQHHMSGPKQHQANADEADPAIVTLEADEPVRHKCNSLSGGRAGFHHGSAADTVKYEAEATP
jgi:hypothetical protein